MASSLSWSTLLYATPSAVLASWALFLVSLKPRKPLPLGSPQLPLIGNPHRVPEINPWQEFLGID
jgi:hypothetical protein